MYYSPWQQGVYYGNWYVRRQKHAQGRDDHAHVLVVNIIIAVQLRHYLFSSPLNEQGIRIASAPRCRRTVNNIRVGENCIEIAI